uniref:Uncharacterized protein n=1 Tax=Myotis myotis TaxID=51298 RepID=A0A7J7R1B7_MYOMY|nr:hypothetical protein mMyoMyo1_011213 [Myotis myotis]
MWLPHQRAPENISHRNNLESRRASPQLRGTSRWSSEDGAWPWVTPLLDPQPLSLQTPDAPSDHQGPLSHRPEGPGATLERGRVPPAAPSFWLVNGLCWTPGSHSHDGCTRLTLQKLVSLEQIHVGPGMLTVQ